MTNIDLYRKISFKSSQIITRNYSTSFSLGIWLMNRKLHEPIYAIYGFVRLTDEIVDTFHNYNKQLLFNEFKMDTYKAIENGISLNPVLNCFQEVVREYNIDNELIECFLNSMEMDLVKKDYSDAEYNQYILGSAEVVGLMCLKVFCNGNKEQYLQLKPMAMKLGAAFQKINFLRDVKADFETLGRTYFPGIEIGNLNNEQKKILEEDIENDFREGYRGIIQLPKSSRFGVYMAYVYYYTLFKKIKALAPSKILSQRIRVADTEKYFLLLRSYVLHSFNIL